MTSSSSTVMSISNIASTVAPAFFWDFWSLDLGQRNLYLTIVEHIGLGQREMFVFLLMLAHSLPMYGLNLAYTLFTRLMPRTSERWRYLPDKRAPHVLQRRAVLYVSIFHLLAPLAPLFGYDLALRWNPSLFDADAVPGVGLLLFQLLVCALCTDTLFYWGHRLLHVPVLYKLIHKQHHEFHTSIGFAAQYAHPVELVFGNVIPVMSGYIIFKMHFVVWCAWTFLAMISTVSAHSGLWYPSFDAGFHDWHHSANIGNYGASPLWDRLCSTDRGWANQQRKLQKRFQPTDPPNSN